MAVAALVGLISFASPCCLPLIPGYVGYVAGQAGTDVTAEDRPSANGASGADPVMSSAPTAAAATVPSPTMAVPSCRRLLAGSLLFVAGVVTIVVGLSFLGALTWSNGNAASNAAHRPGWPARPFSASSSALVGAHAWGRLWPR